MDSVPVKPFERGTISAPTPPAPADSSVTNPPSNPPRAGVLFQGVNIDSNPNSPLTKRVSDIPKTPVSSGIDEPDKVSYQQQITLIEIQFNSDKSPIKITINSLADLYALQHVIQQKEKIGDLKPINLEIKDSVLESLKYLSEKKDLFKNVEGITINSFNSPEVLDFPNITVRSLVIVINTSYSIMIDNLPTVESIIVAQSLDPTLIDTNTCKLNSLLIGNLSKLKFLNVSCNCNLFLDLSTRKLERVEITSLGTIVINEAQKKLFENGTWSLKATEIQVKGLSGGTLIESEKGGVQITRTPNSSPKPPRVAERRAQQPSLTNIPERRSAESPSGSSTDSVDSASGGSSRQSLSRSPRIGADLFGFSPPVSEAQQQARIRLMSQIMKHGIQSVDRKNLGTEEQAALKFLEQDGWVQGNVQDFTVNDDSQDFHVENQSDSAIAKALQEEPELNRPNPNPPWTILNFYDPKDLSIDYSRQNGIHIKTGENLSLVAYLGLSKEWIGFCEKLILAFVLLSTVYLMSGRSSVIR